MDNKSKVTLTVDFKLISLLLLLIIISMLAVWRPWQDKESSSNRTVQVTGESTISAEPDVFVFYPTYEIKRNTQQAALEAASEKSNELVSKIKQLGVEDKNIKTNANSGYEFKPMVGGVENSGYNLTLTITVSDKDMAQKVQNFLLTTTPTGAVTPSTSFSENKKKEVQSQARDKAVSDARAKADQNAKSLGFKVDKVKEISDGQGFSALPFEGGVAAQDNSQSRIMTVQPGENELRYSVTVTYFIK